MGWADPRVFPRILVNDGARPIGGTIIDDNPFRWTNTLCRDGFDGSADEFLLIAYWRDNAVRDRCIR